jgi:hypothetical protein
MRWGGGREGGQGWGGKISGVGASFGGGNFCKWCTYCFPLDQSRNAS